MMPSPKTINHNYPEQRVVVVAVLTPRRLGLLTLIATYIRAHGYAPSARELTVLSELRSTSNIKYNLQILEQNGFLKIPRSPSGNQIAHTMTLTRRGWLQVDKPKTHTGGAIVDHQGGQTSPQL